jgi:glycogen operon protein
VRVSAGAPGPLGATWDGRGTNFALFSAHAEKIELCLFDAEGRERQRIVLPERTGDISHGYLKDCGPGQHYGYRVHGPHDPERGFRFNANKLLLDPYARAISGHLILDELHFGHRYGDPTADLSFDARNNASAMVKGVVTGVPAAPPPARRRPRIPWADTIIYEAHVKGLTQLRDDVPPGWRGTFRALASPALVQHLKRLGVTALELLPIHAFIDDWFVRQRGLHNYWGYSTLAFFVPEPRYVGGDSPEILRRVVDRLHDAGIEVILDVVYNHSCEGDHLGPTLSFRGIDNLSYYRLLPGEPRYYESVTGTGNALNLAHPAVRQMVIDSLRFWAETFHVSGFRFDLATTLARGRSGFDGSAPFFSAVRDDPVLAGLKLIAEPWDIGQDGYRVGGFPPEWSEWNDRFRRSVRQFWLGEGNMLGELGRRLTGSADVFAHVGRSPRASVNYVCAHDGFTLADLVSFERKHNEKNLEGNHDGEDRNDSTNCGIEGPTEDGDVLAARLQLRKNLLASLLLAHGVPMLLAGDEVGNSQEGNNNAYCQDNAIGWVKWSGLGRAGEDLTAFIGRLTALRNEFPQLRARNWLEGRREDGTHDIIWLTPEATEMTADDWNFPNGRFLAYVLGSEASGDTPLYVVLNGADEAITFKLPGLPKRGRWAIRVDTSSRAVTDAALDAGATMQAAARSVLVFSGVLATSGA